jgi:hypothetical protein
MEEDAIYEELQRRGYSRTSIPGMSENETAYFGGFRSGWIDRIDPHSIEGPEGRWRPEPKHGRLYWYLRYHLFEVRPDRPLDRPPLLRPSIRIFIGILFFLFLLYLLVVPLPFGK